MMFKQFRHEPLGQASYLLGCTRAKKALVVDPIADLGPDFYVIEAADLTLEIVGVGYRADPSGTGLTINVGHSHPIEYPAPEGVTLECPNQTTIVVSGADKQKVGQAAAEIRAFRPPEPYKGKGIRYEGEQIRRKAGKTGAVA